MALYRAESTVPVRGANMNKMPTYELTIMIPFGLVSAICFWSIFWNCIIFNIPIDGWGIAISLTGLFSLYGLTNYILEVRKLRKNFVWETLKNG